MKRSTSMGMPVNRGAVSAKPSLSAKGPLPRQQKSASLSLSVAEKEKGAPGTPLQLRKSPSLVKKVSKESLTKEDMSDNEYDNKSVASNGSKKSAGSKNKTDPAVSTNVRKSLSRQGSGEGTNNKSSSGSSSSNNNSSRNNYNDDDNNNSNLNNSSSSMQPIRRSSSAYSEDGKSFSTLPHKKDFNSRYESLVHSKNKSLVSASEWDNEEDHDSQNSDDMVMHVEQKFKAKYNILKRTYEKRLELMNEQMRSLKHVVQNDKVIDSMSKDPSTSAYIPAHVDETIERHIHAERENFLHGMAMKQSEFQVMLSEKEKDIRKLTTEKEDITSALNASFQKVHSCEEIIAGQAGKIAIQEEKIASQEKIITNLQELNRQCTENSMEMQRKNMEDALNLKSKMDEEERERNKAKEEREKEEAERRRKEMGGGAGLRLEIEELERRCRMFRDEKDRYEKQFSDMSYKHSELEAELCNQKGVASDYKRQLESVNQRLGMLRPPACRSQAPPLLIDCNVFAQSRGTDFALVQSLERNLMNAASKDIDIDQLEEKLHACSGELEDLKGKMGQVGEQVEEMLKAEADENEKAMSTIKERVKMMKKAMSEDCRRYKQEVKVAKAELKSAEMKEQEAIRNGILLQDRIEKLRQDLDILQCERDTMDQKSKRVEGENRQLRRCVQELELEKNRERDYVNLHLGNAVKAAVLEAESQWKKDEALFREREAARVREVEDDLLARHHSEVDLLRDQVCELEEIRRQEAKSYLSNESICKTGHISREHHESLVAAEVATAKSLVTAYYEKRLTEEMRAWDESKRIEVQQSVADFVTRAKDMQSQIHSSSLRVKDLEDDISRVSDSLKATQEAVESEVQEKCILAQLLGEANSNITHLKTVLNQCTEENSSLQNKLEGTMQQNNLLETRCRALNGEMAALEEKEIHASNKLVAAESKVRNLEEEMNQKKEELRQREDDLRRRHGEENVVFRRLESERSRLDKEVLAKNFEIEALQSKIEADRSNRKAVELEIERSRMSNEEMRKSVEEMQMGLQQYGLLRQQLQHELVCSEKVCEQLRKEIQTLQADLDTSKKECSVRNDAQHGYLEKAQDLSKMVDAMQQAKLADEAKMEALRQETKDIELYHRKYVRNLGACWKLIKQRHAASRKEHDQMKDAVRKEIDQMNREFMLKFTEVQIQFQNLLSKEQNRVRVEAEKEITAKVMIEKRILEREIQKLLCKNSDLESRLSSLSKDADSLVRYRSNISSILTAISSQIRVGLPGQEGLEDILDQIEKSILNFIDCDTKSIAKGIIEVQSQIKNCYSIMKKACEKPLLQKYQDLHNEFERHQNTINDEKEKYRNEAINEKDMRYQLECSLNESKDKERSILEKLKRAEDSCADYKSRSRMTEDLERSRNEISMIAEIHKIEAESEIRSLRLQLEEERRRFQSEKDSLRSSIDSELHEVREETQRDLQKMIVDHSREISDLESSLVHERTRYRQLQERHDTQLKDLRWKLRRLEYANSELIDDGMSDNFHKAFDDNTVGFDSSTNTPTREKYNL